MEERSLRPGEAHGAHKSRYAARRAERRRGRKNQAAPVGMTRLERGAPSRKRRAQVPHLRRFLGRRGVAAIPPLRGPTRRKAARKKKSGRSGRDDKIGAWRGHGAWPVIC